MFVLVYDEWGGFFDHVHPPVVPDARASSDDGNNFSQLGFRVPSLLASPYARPGYVDHNLYDHASILRFLEWRFLGAPAQGPGKKGDRWFLTKRDRYANNYGASIRMTNPTPELDFPTPLPVVAVAGHATTKTASESSAPTAHPATLSSQPRRSTRSCASDTRGLRSGPGSSTRTSATFRSSLTTAPLSPNDASGEQRLHHLAEDYGVVRIGRIDRPDDHPLGAGGAVGA